MRAHGSLPWIAALAAAGLTAVVAAQAEKETAPDKLPKCVDVRGQARYAAYGYDHLVEIANGCDKTVDCSVATDVNPKRTHVKVAVGQTESVMTYRGSPAREFKPDVTCQLAK